MNPDQGTELRSGRIISSSLETPVPTDPDMAFRPPMTPIVTKLQISRLSCLK